ncbi:MAG: CBS domain-containing protein [Acidobacteriota bacterium]|nr:CBS domain-containing protein [Acidobacteriota bacterium]MDW3229668.1 CBS domain-containing protein [Acidobacteriota bacterium]MDY0231691.1 CBS domain-containing protein [Candidatus Saccharicenans sp.]
MITVKEMLEEKGSEVWTISPEATVFEALKIMADKGIGALVVVENDQVVGVISERDYARKVVLKGKSSLETPVKEIMTTQVYVVTPEATAEECMALMTEKRIRHLPVIQEKKLAGVISIGDVVKSIISSQKITIEHLQNYIMGKYS